MMVTGLVFSTATTFRNHRTRANGATNGENNVDPTINTDSPDGDSAVTKSAFPDTTGGYYGNIHGPNSSKGLLRGWRTPWYVVAGSKAEAVHRSLSGYTTMNAIAYLTRLRLNFHFAPGYRWRYSGRPLSSRTESGEVER